jgi:hypothetical protein
MTGRYGQLSYTSCDSAGQVGGWQVKETGGGITDTEAKLLVSRIRTGLDPVERIPRYPTPDQLWAVPRRLAFYRIDHAAAGYWHTTPAGTDHTGRPGNVFVHVLLDRDAGETANGPRPIELWRSPQWLTPYGGPAVCAAALPDDAPGPGDTITSESVVEFVCDTATWRVGVLCGLLDAVTAALEGGRPVVLGVDSVDAGAQWIGVVSFFMSPGTARRLNFSTFDRGRDVEYVLSLGVHLLVVPRADLEEADIPAGVVVIDEADALFVGELHGQRHRTGNQEIQVTAWSAMAQVALADPSYATQLMADIDEFASGVVDDSLPPALPMAVSVLNRRWGRDAVSEAQSVVAAAPAAAGMYWSR